MEYLFTTKTNKLYERPFRNYTIRQSVACFSGKKSVTKVKIMLHLMQEDSKASVCSAYIHVTDNYTKQMTFPYLVSRVVIMSFPHTKPVDTTLVCSSLRLVSPERNTIFLTISTMEAIFFLDVS